MRLMEGCVTVGRHPYHEYMSLPEHLIPEGNVSKAPRCHLTFTRLLHLRASPTLGKSAVREEQEARLEKKRTDLWKQRQERDRDAELESLEAELEQRRAEYRRELEEWERDAQVQ
ncbi:unnamed protein product [Calypogeia fissa]